MTLHCENGGAIEALRRRARGRGPHRRARARARRGPAALEAEAVARAAALAERGGHARVRRAPVVGARARRGARRAASAASTSSPRRARSTSTSTPRGSTAPTASRSCARRRCATRGTSRSCGTASRPARCTPSRPTTARSRSPTGAPASAPAPRATPTSPRSPAGCPASRPASASCGRACAPGRITARRLGAALRRGAGAHVRAVAGEGQPARRAPTPTWSCGIPQRAPVARRRPRCTWRVDHSPYAGMDGRPAGPSSCSRAATSSRATAATSASPARGRFVSRSPRPT